MPNTTVKLRGFTELISAFANAPRHAKTIGQVWLLHVAQVERTLIQNEAPVRSGRFRKTIQPYARNMVAGVTFEDYPGLGQKLQKWIQAGTGVYGPHHTPIVPRHAKFLRFTIGGTTFFRRSVRGMPPNKFVERGVRTFNPKVRGLEKELKALLVADLKAQIKQGRQG